MCRCVLDSLNVRHAFERIVRMSYPLSLDSKTDAHINKNFAAIDDWRKIGSLSRKRVNSPEKLNNEIPVFGIH